jgi:hypothetical protein
MIYEAEIIKYRNKAEECLKDYSGLSLNHFGIKAKDAKDYEETKVAMGEVLAEVIYKERRIATVRGLNYLFEILEPMNNEIIPKTFLDHISYMAADFERFESEFLGEIISRFDVGNTKGLKFSPKPEIVIEIRNNDLLDSVKDFSS